MLLKACVHLSTAEAAANPVLAKQPAQSLADLLRQAHLAQYDDAFQKLGCVMVEDLCDVEDADMVELGLKPVEIKRLRRFAPSRSDP